MTQEELINYLCDVNKDGEVDVLDVTHIQRYLALFDTKNTNLGEIAFEWRDAEYRSTTSDAWQQSLEDDVKRNDFYDKLKTYANLLNLALTNRDIFTEIGFDKLEEYRKD